MHFELNGHTSLTQGDKINWQRLANKKNLKVWNKEQFPLQLKEPNCNMDVSLYNKLYTNILSVWNNNQLQLGIYHRLCCILIKGPMNAWSLYFPRAAWAFYQNLLTFGDYSHVCAHICVDQHELGSGDGYAAYIYKSGRCSQDTKTGNYKSKPFIPASLTYSLLNKEDCVVFIVQMASSVRLLTVDLSLLFFLWMRWDV